MTERLEAGLPITKEWLDQIYIEAKSAYKKKNEYAIKRGTEIHSILEAYLKHEQYVSPLKYVDEEFAQKLIGNLQGWIKQNNFEALKIGDDETVEQRVYSHEYRYAGTLDLLGTIDIEDESHTIIVDFKSGSTVSREASLQLAAYWHAVEEMNDIQTDSVDQAFVLHVMPTARLIPKAKMLDRSQQYHLKYFLLLRDVFPWISGENKNKFKNIKSQG